MTVREYYYRHFEELSDDKKFHFATRIKNYFHSHDFDDYFKKYVPDKDLAKVLANNDFSSVNNFAKRRPFFEKYDRLFAIEAALFRVNHLLNEYDIDLRREFLNLCPLKDLYSLSDTLMDDDAAIATLSTWAVNVICLTETLFPRGRNVIDILSKKSLKLQIEDPLLTIYLFTHIILCDTNFYTRPINPDSRELFIKMLDCSAEIIRENFDDLILDVRIEFLVCANLIEKDYPELRQDIKAECADNLRKNPYIIDLRRPKSYHTLDGAEHTNVLFIMSGLED